MAKSTSSHRKPFYHIGDAPSTIIGWKNNTPITATYVNSYKGLREASGVKVGDRVRIRMESGGWGAAGQDRMVTGHVAALYETYFRVVLDKSRASVCYAYHAFWDRDVTSRIVFALTEET